MPSRLQRPKPTDPAPRGPLTPAHVACEYRIAAWRDSKLPISAGIMDFPAETVYMFQCVSTAGNGTWLRLY